MPFSHHLNIFSLEEGLLTIKSSTWVGNLDAILALGVPGIKTNQSSKVQRTGGGGLVAQRGDVEASN